MQICQLQAFRGLGLHRSSRKWPVKATIQTKYTYKSGLLLSLRVRTLSPISGLDAFLGVRVLGNIDIDRLKLKGVCDDTRKKKLTA